MENGTAQQQEVITTQSEEAIKPTPKSRVIRISLIAFVVIILFVLPLFLLIQHQNIPSAKETSSVVAQQQNTLITEKTKIASSLDVPPLDPKINWQTNTSNVDESELNIVLVRHSNIEIPFEGKMWTALRSDSAYSQIVSNYEADLEKKGWIVDTTPITFDTFALNGLFADGPCGGVVGFIAYKDGFVRTVTISHEVSPCIGDSLTPIPTPTKKYTTYTLFVSEPKSLESIATYIENQSEK